MWMRGILPCLLAVSWLLGLNLVVDAQDFDVQFLDGKKQVVSQFRVVDDKVLLTVDGKSVPIEKTSLLSIQRSSLGALKPAGLVGLTDGSEVAFADITNANGSAENWELKLRSERTLSIPRNRCSWLLFRSPSGAEIEAWKQMLAEKQDADSLIIARGSGVLDRASGGIVGIEKDSVKFNLGLEGQIISAPREKLLGLQWYRKPADRVQPAVILRTADGSKWMASKLTWEEADKIVLLTAEGMNVTLSPNDLLALDFSSANLRWLSELPALEKKAAPRIQSKLVIAGRDDLMAPRFQSKNNSADPQDLDLRFSASGEIVFRVPEGCRKFESRIQRSGNGDVRAQLELEIWENDSKIWNADLQTDQTSLNVSIDVRPEKRLKLVMKAKSELMAGCEVTWIQPRFLR